MKTPAASALKSIHPRHNLTEAEKRNIAFGVCDRISRGELLHTIASGNGVPHPNTLRKWARSDGMIAAAYSAARHDRLDQLMAEICEIVDAPPSMRKDARGNLHIDPASVALLKQRLETSSRLSNSINRSEKAWLTNDRSLPSHAVFAVWVRRLPWMISQ
jgi:hypothetical protein